MVRLRTLIPASLAALLIAMLVLSACTTRDHYDDPILPDRDVDTSYNQTSNP